MTEIPADILTGDDPLYEELYDVRREAEAAGNFIEEDQTERIAALRDAAPVHKGKLRELLGLPHHDRHVFAVGRPHYVALSWDACEAAFRDPQTFSSRVQHHPNPENLRTMGILEMDGPEHRAYRRTIQPHFLMEQALGWWRQRTIDGIVEKLIERLQTRASAELNIDYCARIPVYTITTAIGMDGARALEFRDAYMRSSGTGRVPVDEARAAAAKVQGMLGELVSERRARPADDLVSFLIATRLKLPGEEPRPLTDQEIITHARLVMVAGGGTSWRQLGITLWALLTHADQFAEVKADRALLEAGIEEALRWNPTAPIFSRLVERDTELFGVAMEAGSVIELCLGSANRDSRHWPDAERFDLHRPRRTNMAFGLGAHRCLGMNVARVEIARGIGALLDAFPNLRLDPDAPAPFLTGGLEQRGISGLPVLLR